MAELITKIFIKNYKDTDNPEVRKKYGYLGSFFGIALNICLFMGKLFVGILSGAVSVTADAFNNLSDAGSSVMSFIGFKIAGSPADKEHPFGHGRMEYVSGLIISFVIMLMGFELGKSSVAKIFKSEDINISKLTFIMLGVSIAVKFFMAYFYTYLSRKIDSATLKAAAADSISDCISTGAVIISMLVSLFGNINIDGYIGTLVAVFIFRTGFITAKESISLILGNPTDPEFEKEIEDIVMSYPNIVGVHDLIVNDYGVGNKIISLHAEIPDNVDFKSAHEIVDLIEDDLKIKYGAIITIHMDPVAIDDDETLTAKKHTIKIIREIDSKLSIHDFRMLKKSKGKHNYLVFDLSVPFDYKLDDKQLTQIITEKLEPEYFPLINIDRKN